VTKLVKIGQRAPDLALSGYYQGQEMSYNLKDYRGRFVIVFFYAGDSTSVCSTEVTAFNDHVEDFNSKGVSILGVSVDPLSSHKSWAGELKLQYPILSDEGGKVSRVWEVYDEASGRDFRGTFIVDPKGILRFMSIGESKVGRGILETVRVVEALQTGEACPVDWHPGDATL